jgi:hypothetical protein
MIRLLMRLWVWIAEQLVGPGPAHNHEEGDWRPDCPNCGIPAYQRWK